MQRAARKTVNYTRKFQQLVVYAVMREGYSIASICNQYGIDEPYAVREWVRREMKKRGLVRIPKTMVKRKNAPKVQVSEAINRQFQRNEELIIYQQCLIEAMYQEATDEQKKNC